MEIDFTLALREVEKVLERGIETHPDAPTDFGELLSVIVLRGDNLKRAVKHSHEYMFGGKVLDEHGMSVFAKDVTRRLVQLEYLMRVAGEKHGKQTNDTDITDCHCRCHSAQ